METRSRQVWYGVFAVSVFLLADNARNLLLHVEWFRDLFHQFPRHIPNGSVKVLQIALCFLGVIIAHRVWPAAAAKELGMRAPFRRAMSFAFLASLPMLLAFALTAKSNPKLSALALLNLVVVGPLAEEVLYRGYLFRQLYRRAGFNFWIAVLVSAAAFGLGHLANVLATNKIAVWVGEVGITGSGGVFFAWLFVRWRDNVWVPFGMHGFMNLWWELFAVDNTAIGGWVANVARALTLTLAIVLTLKKDRIWKSKPGAGELLVGG